MIVKLSANNFLSFADRQKFTAQDYLSKSAMKNIEVIDNWRINSSSLIYGPPASGKSNILKIISCFKEMILTGTIPYSFVDYQFGSGQYSYYNEEASDLMIQFYTDGVMYTYGVSLFFKERKIACETLYINDNHKHKDKMIFTRTEEKVEFGQYFKSLMKQHDCTKTMNLIIEYFNQPAMLLLNYLFNFHDIFEAVDDLKNIKEYFRYNVNTSYNQEKFFAYDTYSDIDSFEDSFIENMGKLGFKLDNLNLEDVSAIYDGTFLTTELKQTLENFIGQQVIVPIVDNTRNRLYVFESQGTDDTYVLYSADPSYGGNALGKSAGVCEAMKMACMLTSREPIQFIIDDFGNNLHPTSFRWFISNWMSSYTKKHLIATTNNYGAFDNKFINAWAITLTEMAEIKQFEGLESTCISNLGESYRLNSKAPLTTIYFDGAIGALPRVFDPNEDTYPYEDDEDPTAIMDIAEDDDDPDSMMAVPLDSNMSVVNGQVFADGELLGNYEDIFGDEPIEEVPGLINLKSKEEIMGVVSEMVEDPKESNSTNEVPTEDAVEVYKVDENGIHREIQQPSIEEDQKWN